MYIRSIPISRFRQPHKLKLLILLQSQIFLKMIKFVGKSIKYLGEILRSYLVQSPFLNLPNIKNRENLVLWPKIYFVYRGKSSGHKKKSILRSIKTMVIGAKSIGSTIWQRSVSEAVCSSIKATQFASIS